MEKKWPFRLGTTSFIYPDHIIPNVKKLGNSFDEIELLIFESQPEYVLPSKDEIRELSHLSEELSVTYNIHLPTDISGTIVKNTCTALGTPEIKFQGGKLFFRKALDNLHHHRIVHVPAIQRMGMGDNHSPVRGIFLQNALKPDILALNDNWFIHKSFPVFSAWQHKIVISSG